MTGGRCVLLLEHDPRSGRLQATSGHGLDALPTDPWVVSSSEASLMGDSLARSAPTLVSEADRQMPELSSRLATSSIMLLPLLQGSERLGLLAIGFDRPPAVGPGPEISEVTDAFVTALELFRLRENEARHRDVRRLLDQFAETIGETLDLSAGLDSFCENANRLFGADRTEVWIHDRRARHLALRASSDPEHPARGLRVAADDPMSLASSAMRRTHVEIHPPVSETATATVTVPLRGCRRALGAIVFESVRIETGSEMALVDRAEELGGQLASAIENIQLLENVVTSRRQLENAFDSIAHLVVVWDRLGRVVHANRAFATRVGLAREALVNRPLADLIGPELQAWLTSEAAGPAGVESRPPATIEIVDPVLRGPFMVTVTELRDHKRERAGSVLVARDLTPQAQLRAEREELQQRLTQSEKLAALGQFIAGIAHELNNPLQGVLGHLELMRVTGAFPKNLRREVQTIYREADRAAKIVRNLLAFSGSRRSVRRSVSVNAVLQKVVALRARACRSADIELARRYDPKLPRVQSDPLLLHQVFLNIVMNAEHAIAATGGGGRIEISTARSASGKQVVVSVRDTGAGIPPDVLPRIFEPFYTTKEVGKGTGLGLAITYGIVQ